MNKKYEYWAWMKCGGWVISPHFSSEKKAREWMKHQCFIGGHYSLFAKRRQENEGGEK